MQWHFYSMGVTVDTLGLPAHSAPISLISVGGYFLDNRFSASAYGDIIYLIIFIWRVAIESYGGKPIKQKKSAKDEGMFKS
jgi:hypothetical protein